ncbi:hypothetical protein GOP47_0004555 [Adiantum capillus-veneris]|uniref:RING-type E3 ubiquitin transferase n=1 Tax=Adiantum capillus-veneris TaxID=13818 RepID=A0A9D4V9H2_ADICA|nr:hypothetical protein GOP47_0004555 [Adiantum capillus-veneris]
MEDVSFQSNAAIHSKRARYDPFLQFGCRLPSCNTHAPESSLNHMDEARMDVHGQESNKSQGSCAHTLGEVEAMGEVEAKPAPDEHPSIAIEDLGSFDCHICLEVAQEPVVTICGHLFCWPCIYQWLHLHSLAKDCPVCKASLGDDSKIVPLYGKGKFGSPDPRSSTPLPHRPHGHWAQDGGPPPYLTPEQHTTPPPMTTSSFGTLEPWIHPRRPPSHRLPFHSTFHPPNHRVPLFEMQFHTDNEFFSASSSSSTSDNGSLSREGFTSRLQASLTSEQREVLFYRLYIILVCVVIALVLFF